MKDAPSCEFLLSLSSCFERLRLRLSEANSKQTSCFAILRIQSYCVNGNFRNYWGTWQPVVLPLPKIAVGGLSKTTYSVVNRLIINTMQASFCVSSFLHSWRGGVCEVPKRGEDVRCKSLAQTLTACERVEESLSGRSTHCFVLLNRRNFFWGVVPRELDPGRSPR